MKNCLLILVSIFFLTSMTVAQEAAKQPVKDSTDIHSNRPKANSQQYSEPKIVDEIQVESVNTDDNGIQFSMAGLLLGSLQNWSEVKTDDSKIGFGFSGDLFAGIIIDDMYVGVGPHLGYSFWTLSKSAGGITASATTSVNDFGISLGAAWEGFYLTLGAGNGGASVTATVGDESQTVDMPESIGYKRVGIGWFDGFAIGLAVVSYSDENIPNNLNRVEMNLGWAF